jgi:diaminobutyrate-2-oxoglutarate transaminase
MSAGALAVTGSRAARRGLEGTLDGVVRLPFEGYRGAGVEELDRFAEMVADPSGGIEPVAAIIVETVQGEGGLNVASPAWLAKLRKIASDIGALLIVDDVQAGCGRTGSFFSFERTKVVPDVVCLSKSISGFGLPMSLLLLSPEIDVWRPAEHSGTFRGNSLAFVAATIAAEQWAGGSFEADVQSRSTLLDTWLCSAVLSNSTIVRQKKGLGMMAGLEFKDPAIAASVMRGARDRGLLTEGCGPHDEVIKIMAPLNIELDLFAEGLKRLGCAIEAECGVRRAA